MKRFLSILLILALLSALGAVAVHAEDNGMSHNSKFTPDLSSRIATHHAVGGDATIDITVYFADETLCINDMPGWGGDDASASAASVEYAEYLINHNLATVQAIFSDCPGYQACAHPYKGYTYYADVDYTLIGCCRAWDFDMNDLDILAADPRVRLIDTFSVNDTKPKCDPYLSVVLNAVEPEDWIAVYVTYAGKHLTVADMPSWPTARGSVEEIQRQIAAAREEYAAYQREVEAVFFGEAFADTDVRYLFRGGSMGIVVVKAKDIERIASRSVVRDISYFYNAIAEPEDDYANPYLYDNIDDKLADAVSAMLERGEYGSVNVYIDLDLDTKLMQDMPSWPDYTAAKKEYLTYLEAQNKLYDAALAEITESVGRYALSDLSTVCYEALTARVAVDKVVALANHKNVRSLRLWDPDAVNSDGLYRHTVDDPGEFCRDRLLAQYNDLHWESKTDRAPLSRYEVRYRHMRVPDDTPYAYDWALVEADLACIINCAIYSDVVGGRRLYAPGWKQQPFTFGIGLYDAEQDRFFDLTEIDFDDYPDLYEVFQTLDLGIRDDKEIYGDADGDRVVTVMDATRIQRVIAGLTKKTNIVATSADVDRDGAVTVLDATRIQRFKAGLCALDGPDSQADKSAG